jgi:hypothetical protein
LAARSLAAPASTIKRTVSRWPLAAATRKGVAPVCAVWSMTDPDWTSSWTVWKRPLTCELIHADLSSLLPPVTRA